MSKLNSIYKMRTRTRTKADIPVDTNKSSGQSKTVRKATPVMRNRKRSGVIKTDRKIPEYDKSSENYLEIINQATINSRVVKSPVKVVEIINKTCKYQRASKVTDRCPKILRSSSKHSMLTKSTKNCPEKLKSVIKCSVDSKITNNSPATIKSLRKPNASNGKQTFSKKKENARKRLDVMKIPAKLLVNGKTHLTSKRSRLSKSANKSPDIVKSPTNPLAKVVNSITKTSAPKLPVWQSMKQSDIPMTLNVSSHRKSRRISNVKNKDVYDIEASLSPMKAQTNKPKIHRAPRPKIPKNITKSSFKFGTLTTDREWKNPLSIPTSQFYRKSNDVSAITVHNSHYENISDYEDVSNDDIGYDASVSVDANEEESCFSLPSLSVLVSKKSNPKQSTLFKTTSTPYGFRTYSKPVMLTKEEELHMCFGFEEPEKESLLFSPVEKPKATTVVQIPSCLESDTDNEACLTRLTTKLPTNHDIMINKPIILNTNKIVKKVHINSYLSKQNLHSCSSSNKQKRPTKMTKKTKIQKTTYESDVTRENISQESSKKVRKPKKIKAPRNPLKEIQSNSIAKEENKDKSVLEDWASDINSHFSEIDEMELFVE